VPGQSDHFTYHEQYHFQSQYIPDEEHFVSKYLCIDHGDKIMIGNFCFDISRYAGDHHSQKNKDVNEFVGDTPNSSLTRLPSSYSFFYNDEIRHLVEIIYANDILHYQFYTFPYQYQ